MSGVLEGRWEMKLISTNRPPYAHLSGRVGSYVWCMPWPLHVSSKVNGELETESESLGTSILCSRSLLKVEEVAQYPTSAWRRLVMEWKPDARKETEVFHTCIMYGWITGGGGVPK